MVAYVGDLLTQVRRVDAAQKALAYELFVLESLLQGVNEEAHEEEMNARGVA
jgi:hypothetical protein